MNNIFFWSLTDNNTHLYNAKMAWTSVECFLCLHIQANIGFKRDRYLIGLKYLSLYIFSFNCLGLMRWALSWLKI